MYRSTPIIYRMAEAFFRNIRLFLIAFFIVSVVTMAAFYLRSKAFAATALVQVNKQDIGTAIGDPENYGWSTPAQVNANQLSVLLQDPNFVQNALNNAKLRTPISTDPHAGDPRAAQLAKKLSVFVQADTLFAINLVWDDPAEAEGIVQSIRDQYISEIGAEKYAQTAGALSFLDSQIKDYTGRMTIAENLLTQYKQKHAGELPEAQSAQISQLSALQAQLDNMKITAKDSAAQKAVLEQRLAQITPQTIAEQTSVTNPSPLDTQINAMKARRDVLLTHMLATHPVVENLTSQIASLEKQRDAKHGTGSAEAANVTKIRREDNPEWQALHQQLVQANIAQQTQTMQMQKLQQQIAQYQVLVNNIPDAQRVLTNKTRDYTLLKAQLDTMLQRREQVRLDGNLARVTASSSLAPIGYVYAEPTTGKTKMIGMFGGSLILGLIVGLVLVILSEWADGSVRYGTDAERLLGVPVLAVLPEARELRLLTAGGGGSGGLRRLLPNAKAQEDKEGAVRVASAMNAPAAEGAQ